MLIEKFRNSTGSIELSISKVKLILEYIYDYTDHGFSTIVEDDILLSKFYHSVREYSKVIESEYKSKVDSLAELRLIFENSFPRIVVENNKPEKIEPVVDEIYTNMDLKRKAKQGAHIYSRSKDLDNRSVGTPNELAEKLKNASEKIIDSHEKKDEKDIVKDIIRKTKGKGIL